MLLTGPAESRVIEIDRYVTVYDVFSAACNAMVASALLHVPSNF